MGVHLPLCFSLETKCWEANKSAAISGCVKPLETGPQEATAEAFEQDCNLFPAMFEQKFLFKLITLSNTKY